MCYVKKRIADGSNLMSEIPGKPKMRENWPSGFRAGDLVRFGKYRQWGGVTLIPETEAVPNGEVPIVYFKNSRREHGMMWVPADDLELVTTGPTG